MNIRLDGKTALVCGGSQGIGKASAIELSRAGASVILVARYEESLKIALAELETSHHQTHTYICADFDYPKDVIKKINALLEKTNPIHILINNSGGPPPGPIINEDADSFRIAFNRHVINNQNMTKAVLPGMKDAGFGRIINIISTTVKEPLDGLGVSNTIRGAVASWAKTMAGECAPFDITVNNILPGFTNTGRLQSLINSIAEKENVSPDVITERFEQSVPAKRFANPKETASAVIFLASEQASYINGINLPVDGGRTKSL
ncbi:MAG: SDR family oxidoreductase [Candidatus Marinimicrobia bacterium]|nr:SDR family oxidoreductase [Candidatus Neomarinimicrobiota bacterium]